MDLGGQATPVDAKTFVLAFLKKLIQNREKQYPEAFTDHLDSSIVTLWEEVLSQLEDVNRKLINIQTG